MWWERGRQGRLLTTDAYVGKHLLRYVHSLPVLVYRAFVPFFVVRFLLSSHTRTMNHSLSLSVLSCFHARAPPTHDLRPASFISFTFSLLISSMVTFRCKSCHVARLYISLSRFSFCGAIEGTIFFLDTERLSVFYCLFLS